MYLYGRWLTIGCRSPAQVQAQGGSPQAGSDEGQWGFSVFSAMLLDSCLLIAYHHRAAVASRGFFARTSTEAETTVVLLKHVITPETFAGRHHTFVSRHPCLSEAPNRHTVATLSRRSPQGPNYLRTSICTTGLGGPSRPRCVASSRCFHSSHLTTSLDECRWHCALADASTNLSLRRRLRHADG